MLEALMLILLGALLMALLALALAPVLWSRAVRVTEARVHEEVHGAAFTQASEHVSKRFESRLAKRERELREEIAELETSRDKISSEATGRVRELEEIRAGLESDLAARDAALAENRAAVDTLAARLKEFGSRAASLGDEAAALAASAVPVAAEPELPIDGEEPAQAPEHAPEATAVSHDEPVYELDQQAGPAEDETSEVDPAPASDAEPVGEPAPEQPHANGHAGTAAEESGNSGETDDPGETPPPQTLADRIRALRDGVSA